MEICSRCGSIMVDVSFYDPEGLVPLEGIIKKSDGEWFACINRVCQLEQRGVDESVKLQLYGEL